MTTLRAFAFLLAYCAWLWAMKASNSPERLAKSPLRAGAINAVFVSIGLCILTALHFGNVDLKVVAALYLIGQTSLVITLVFGAFLDIRSNVVSACLRWGAFQLGRHKLTRLLFLWLPLLALIAYPFLVVYTILNPPGNLPLVAIQSAVGLLFWLLVPITLWTLWGILSTRFWREAIRAQMLLLFASGALNVALYFVILLWAFNCSGTGTVTSLLGTKVTYSPRIVGFVFIGIVVCYLAPYLRGIYLGRQTLKNFHRARREYLNRIIRVLKCPEINDAEGALGMLHEELANGIISSQKADPAFSQAELLTDPNITAVELKYEKEAFPIAREHDVRFEQIDWFSHLITLVENAMESIKKQGSVDAKKTIMSQWIPFFEQLKVELNEHIEASPRASALLVLGILASATVGAIFSKAGDALWELLKGVLK